MRNKGLYLVLGIIFIAGLLLFNSFYVLEEGYQAVLIRFSKIVDVHTEAGLKFKLPFGFADADIVKKFPKKLLSWDGSARIIPTGIPEAQLIWVDTTARWKIVDIEKFYESLGSKYEAMKKLDDIIDPAVRTIINANLLTETVRSTAQKMTFDKNDIISYGSFILELKNPSTEAAFSVREFAPQRLKLEISSFKTQQSQIANYDTYSAANAENVTDATKTEIIDFLNDLLTNKNLYQEDKFSEILLVDHTKSLLNKQLKEELSEEEQTILNRLLIEAVFPTAIKVNPVKRGRSLLSAQILDYAREEMYLRDNVSDEIITQDGKPVNQFGIELIDIVIRQIRYAKDVRESVFDQMVQERNKEATAIRSAGQAEREKLLGEMKYEVQSLESEGTRQAEDIKGEADAFVTETYARAYNKDRGFFEFWRTLESYKKVLPQFGKTLSTDSEYFKYLYNSQGR
ncbi:MAG: hypothetical protein JXR70_16315 [Spirochaetales bacterium]|nr:hypothetical protein [Spirochaetales bacterium]